MSAEKSIEWQVDGKRHALVVYEFLAVGTYQRGATRADLDKALESLGLIAMSKALRDQTVAKLAELKSERDAAIAAKEAAERLTDHYRAQNEKLDTELMRAQPVVEAARAEAKCAESFLRCVGEFCEANAKAVTCPCAGACSEYMDHFDTAHEKLSAALCALDAGEAPRPNEQTDIGSLAEHVSEQLAKANDECEQLRVQLEALMERSEKLRLALIKRGTWGDGEGITCPVCEFEWDVCHPEKHSKECLAAPQKGPGE